MTTPNEQQAAFLAAIRDDLDDDTPRLVFADWLEEHGDPRGAFIRAQCLLYRTQEDDPAEAELRRCVDELFDRHVEEWEGDAPGKVEVTFDRGLLDVKVEAEELLGEPMAR